MFLHFLNCLSQPAPLPLPNRSNESKLTAPLSLFIASGPYTDPAHLNYSAIDLLLHHLRENAPDVLILTGPFVDCRQEQNQSLQESYDEVFEEIISRFLEFRQKFKTTLILIPSSRDLHHDFVFPQNPFYNKSKTFEGVLMFPNPCFLNIGDFSLAITSEDVLFDMNIDYKYKGSKTRMDSICNTLLEQASFYPIWPPFFPESGNYIPLDLTFEGRLAFPHSPDLLVLPSDVGKPFVSPVASSLVLNPGKCIKRNDMGSFARMTIYPREGAAETFETGIEVVHL